MATDLNFATFVQDLQDMGFYDYFLPFILIFAITYALLEASHILGEKKGVNIVISMAVGFILIAQQPVVQTINLFLQKSSLIIIVILVALLVVFLISGKSLLQSKLLGISVVLVILALIWALSPSLGLEFPPWLDMSDRTKNLLLMLLLFFIVPLFLVTSKTNQTGNIFSRALESISDGLQGNNFNPKRK